MVWKEKLVLQKPTMQSIVPSMQNPQPIIPLRNPETPPSSKQMQPHSIFKQGSTKLKAAID